MLNFGPRRRTRKSPPAWEWRITDDQDEGVDARLLIETVAPGGGKSKGVYLQAIVHGLEGFELSDVNHRSARHGAQAAENLGLQVIAEIKSWERMQEPND